MKTDNDTSARSPEDTFQFLFRTTSDALLILSFQSEASFICKGINDAACTMLGYPRSGIIHKDLNNLFEAESSRLLKAFIKGPHSQSHFELETGRGKKLFVDLERLQLNGQQNGDVLLLVKDVTRQRRIEERLQQIEKLEAFGQLAGGIAHDFNNVLAGIIGIGELGLRSISESDYSYGVLQKIIGKADAASGLVRQLMIFSRNKQFNPRKLNLNPIIKTNHQFLERYLGENIILKTDLTSDLYPVKSDISVIDQIIINLAINARDAMPDGGALRIITRNVELEEPLHTRNGIIPAGHYVEMVFQDNGVGMNADIQEHIFEPFFTTKEIGYGTGLGMSIVYGLIKKHQGYITFESTPGEGTSFHIYLPACFHADVPTTHTAVPSLQKGTETVLIAEDDQELMATFQAALSGQGYTVLTAANGLEALTLFEKNKGKVDLILSDLIMPVFGGTELALVARQIRPDIKILLMSSHGDREEPGFPFIQKPFRAHGLLDKIRTVMDGVEAQTKSE